MRSFACLFLALSLGSCRGCGDREPPPVARTPAAEPPVAAPPGVLAELAIASPDASWKRAQTTVGGITALAPQTFGGVLASALDVDALVGAQVDEEATARAMVVGDAQSVRPILVVHLKSSARARSALVDGDASKWRVTAGAGDIDVIEGAGGPDKSPWVLGFAHGDFLVAAKSKSDIEVFGPYAYRTLPTLAQPAAMVSMSLSHAALEGPIAGWLGAKVKSTAASLLVMDDALRTAHGGRAPDYGEPRVLVDALAGLATSLVAVVGDFDHGSGAVDLSPAGFRVDLLLTPPATGGVSRDLLEQLRPGDASALLDASAGALVTAMFRSDGAARAQNAADLADTLRRTTGKRLSAPDGAALAAGLAALAKARGDVVIASVALAAPRGLLLTTAVNSETGASRALGQIVDIGTRKPIYGLIEGMLDAKSLHSGPADFEGFDKGRLVTMVRAGGPRSLLGPEVGLAFATSAGRLALAFGPDPAALMKTASRPERKIGAEPQVADALRALGSEASFAAVVVPSAMSASPRGEAIVVSSGRRGADVFARVSAGRDAVRQLLMAILRGL